jgi:hypothetical protein
LFLVGEVGCQEQFCHTHILCLVVVFWRVLSLNDALPCSVLPCPAMPCPALPCPALPSPALSCPAPHGGPNVQFESMTVVVQPMYKHSSPGAGFMFTSCLVLPYMCVAIRLNSSVWPWPRTFAKHLAKPPVPQLLRSRRLR